jgi:GDP/UDP-N,N'-diacetylbacillosamine 2-epimerase (hydrolysing)
MSMKPLIRKICVVTGTRADYGLLRWVMQGLQDDAGLKLQIVATGMHLSPEFGLTYKEIEQDGFDIDYKLEMLTSSDTAVGIAKSMGLGLIGFADAFNQLQPDLIVVLGDRFEILAAVSAALVARIPVAHLHGGEATEGAIDESFRHAITKMSHLHFVAAEDYRKRVIQLGENPERVFLVGGLGVDGIKRTKLLNRQELEASLNLKFVQKNLLITFHPVTLDISSAEKQMVELLTALSGLQDTTLIFTMPNADTDGRILMQMIYEFVKQHHNAYVFSSLGQLRYFSCIAQVDAVIGNSSSGLLEVPSFHKATINIGDRQRGRLSASSVINCEPTFASILSAIDIVYSDEFQSNLHHVKSPYGEGGASERVIEIIKRHTITDLMKKSFYDLPFNISRVS